MSAARPPEGARTAARQGEGTPMSAARPPEGARTAARQGEGTPASRHVVVMGVAGCGKSALGRRLARRLGLPLIEGDDFHSPSSIRKMRLGVPLADEDRAGWLHALAGQLAAAPLGAVLTCSALKAGYREVLRQAVPDLRFVYLAMSQAQALRRVTQRSGHFYPPSLVASQFEALQDPSAEAGVLVLDGSAAPDVLARRAGDWLAGAAAGDTLAA